ncbi:hypothetical protein [Nocardiopsis alba]
MNSPSARPDPAPYLITAIKNEIKAVLSDTKAGPNSVSLKKRKRVRTGGGSTPHEYMFSCERWRQDFDSGELLVRLSHSRDDWRQATARRHPNGKIHVTTEADLGSAPGNARLREDETRSLRSLLTRIEDRGQRSSPVNTITAGWIVGQESQQVRYLRHPEKYIAEYADLALNDQQRLGVEQALESDITFIWGPPGTGKPR